jgi:CDGSH iron-sulfur domain-containing protein 3
MTTRTNSPVGVDVEEGKTYAWCRCGLSQTLPLCDGTHKQHSEQRPVKFVAEATKRLYVCGCGKTKTPPFCDASHCFMS